MRKILLSILISSFSYLAYCQTNTETMNRSFEIVGTGFQIVPDEQVVYRQQMTGGSRPDGGEWWGYQWVPCPEIDFKTTSLIFMGGGIYFKEFLSIPADYIPSLRVIYQSIGYENDYTTILSPLENAIYNKLNNGVIGRMDISGYTYIGQMIFKNKAGKLYINATWEITIPIDTTSLRLVFSNSYIGAYYTDKNGLYYFSNNEQQQQLESSNGKPVQAVLHDGYFVYGDAAYPYGNIYGKDKKAMRMNVNELKLIFQYDDRYLADNDKIFTLPSSYTTSTTSASLADIIQKGRPQEPLSEWNWFDFFVVGKDNLKNNTVYYPSRGMNMSGSCYYLIKTPSGFYGINRNNRSEAVKYDNVMIFNIEKGDYEPIEVEQFRRLTDNYYIYKNQMYYDNSRPVETELDLQKLHTIRLNGMDTEFYTDGTFLVGGYNLSKLTTEQKEGQEWLKFEKPLFRDVDWGSLQVVNEKEMVDKNNIYQVESSLLQIIPIKDLGLNVKVIPLWTGKEAISKFGFDNSKLQ